MILYTFLSSIFTNKGCLNASVIAHSLSRLFRVEGVRGPFHIEIFQGILPYCSVLYPTLCVVFILEVRISFNEMKNSFF